jgi:hypothetical protein
MRIFTDQVEMPDATTKEEIYNILVEDGRLEDDVIEQALEQLDRIREGSSIDIGVKQVLETVPTIKNASNPPVRAAELLLERIHWKEQESRDAAALF